MTDLATAATVVGHIELGPDHHTPWGIVHGGVYAAAVESAASLGASRPVRHRTRDPHHRNLIGCPKYGTHERLPGDHPSPAEPDAVARSNRDTIARLGQIQVCTLGAVDQLIG